MTRKGTGNGRSRSKEESHTSSFPSKALSSRRGLLLNGVDSFVIIFDPLIFLFDESTIIAAVERVVDWARCGLLSLTERCFFKTAGTTRELEVWLRCILLMTQIRNSKVKGSVERSLVTKVPVCSDRGACQPPEFSINACHSLKGSTPVCHEQSSPESIF